MGGTRPGTTGGPGNRRLLAALALLLALSGPAVAQGRIVTLIETNGWRVTVSPSASGPICSMGTDANTMGRAFWMRVERLRGDLHGYIHVSDQSWSVPRDNRGQIVVFLDNRRAELSWTGTSYPTRIEASYLGAWNNFMTFCRGLRRRQHHARNLPGQPARLLDRRPARHAAGIQRLPRLHPLDVRRIPPQAASSRRSRTFT
ncbi:MAG: hypothetical protein NZM27_07605 [Acetobacteraceae bacterium]|nr:hypothetical protein [Acetobacteraceae bacterium]MDW8397610.1 hypothetical protein [Acetobacteraceae bacterium]